MNETNWSPLSQGKLDEITGLFHDIYPLNEYNSLADEISTYWISRLTESWQEKDEELKKMDLAYNPSDPLSRIEQKTTVIAYADSISREGEKTLETLDSFLKQWFPAVGGLHILPACSVVENRFNDGYFSQVERDNIHSRFGSNELFADIMHRYFSMNDLVLGHVDIENPVFKEYLEGHDESGKKFYVFSMEEYESLKAAGSFDRVFRPRPFPLFTIFRRLPEEMPYRSLSYNGKVEVMIKLIRKMRGVSVENEVINMLWLFNKVKNDQMLLDEDYQIIVEFLEWMKSGNIAGESVFTESRTQEVQHVPYIFIPEIKTEEDLLMRCGYTQQQAEAVGEIFRETNWRIFGEEVRVLTTFSHVQADVNTTTFEGLKALCNDLMFYLTKDMNMLRLDAVNYAFKKWGSSCFGLPELDMLMKIVYLSMECISPRIIPNLEVNDSLTTVLTQMSAGDAAPPMMHDFHLASLLPAVFHSKNAEIAGRIFKKIAEFNVPHERIRFSLSESHDGKSVRGSMDLLTFEERMILTGAVKANGGFVKYKSITARECSGAELNQFCSESGYDYKKSVDALFVSPENDVADPGSNTIYKLKPGIDNFSQIMNVLDGFPADKRESAEFFYTRILEGRDPYELCITTRDSLPQLENQDYEADRFLAFQTFAFAVMGRNVKTIYFNDLLAMPNDYRKVKKTGELRNIKRTKLNLDELLPKLEYNGSFEARVSKGINNLIALVDSDPALNFRGNEAELFEEIRPESTAVIRNSCGEDESLIIINMAEETQTVFLDTGKLMFDNISGINLEAENGKLRLLLEPFGRYWLTENKIEIPGEKLRD